jgi:hypothetical protein
MLGKIASLATQLANGVGAVVGVRAGTEEPRFVVEQHVSGLEIRRYDPRIAAQTTVTGAEEQALREGFRRLAGYIFGGNHGKSKIAMTAPVSRERGASAKRIAMTAPVSQEAGADGSWVVRFFMPAEWTLDTLPEPDDRSVELVAVPPATFAVLRFSGDRGPRAVAARTDEALHALPGTGYEPTGPAEVWFYDPPWTVPCRRRTEIAVSVRET